MGEFTDKAIGKTKKTYGNYTGNRSLQAKGTVQELRGRAKGGLKEVGKSVRKATSTVRRKAASQRPKPATRAGTQSRGKTARSRD